MSKQEIEIVNEVVGRLEKLFEDETRVLATGRKAARAGALVRRDEYQMLKLKLRALAPSAPAADGK